MSSKTNKTGNRAVETSKEVKASRVVETSKTSRGSQEVKASRTDKLVVKASSRASKGKGLAVCGARTRAAASRGRKVITGRESNKAETATGERAG